jgi:hypothetical protein
MKFSTIWNSLRVLAILGLGCLLLFQNIINTVSPRRALFELTRGRPELGTPQAQEKLGRIQDTFMEVLYINVHAIPMLVIIALFPYVRTRTKEVSAEGRGGSGPSAGIHVET